MKQTVTIRPVNKREHMIVDRVGSDGWQILQESKPLCFDGRTAVLVEKDGHIRWVLKEQVK